MDRDAFLDPHVESPLGYQIGNLVEVFDIDRRPEIPGSRRVSRPRKSEPCRRVLVEDGRLQLPGCRLHVTTRSGLRLHVLPPPDHSHRSAPPLNGPLLLTYERPCDGRGADRGAERAATPIGERQAPLHDGVRFNGLLEPLLADRPEPELRAAEPPERATRANLAPAQVDEPLARLALNP